MIHGVREEKDEITDNIIIDTCNRKLGLQVCDRNICRSHRMGPARTDNKPRPIIVKFVRHNVRQAVFSNKRKLKGSRQMITESLTNIRAEYLRNVIESYNAKNVWTYNGDISVMYRC